jgi:hypothetical protein
VHAQMRGAEVSGHRICAGHRDVRSQRHRVQRGRQEKLASDLGRARAGAHVEPTARDISSADAVVTPASSGP